MRLTAAAESSTSQSARVSKVRLSVATTELGSCGTCWVPLLSSTAMVGPDAESESDDPQADRARARPLTRASERVRLSTMRSFAKGGGRVGWATSPRSL